MKTLIVGGGISGAVCAIALRKAGLEAEICEAFDYGADNVGAFLTLGVNGLDARRVVDVGLRSLGGFDTPRMTLYLGNGRRLVEFDHGGSRADGRPRAPFDASEDPLAGMRTRIDYKSRPLTSGRGTGQRLTKPNAKDSKCATLGKRLPYSPSPAYQLPRINAHPADATVARRPAKQESNFSGGTT